MQEREESGGEKDDALVKLFQWLGAWTANPYTVGLSSTWDSFFRVDFFLQFSLFQTDSINLNPSGIK